MSNGSAQRYIRWPRWLLWATLGGCYSVNQRDEPMNGEDDSSSGTATDEAADDAQTDESSDAPAPTVGELAPADGATGVLIGTELRIAFSEPMDAASVEAAFEPLGLDRGELSIAWNDAGDAMTVATGTAIAYAQGGSVGDVEANVYGFTIGTGASSASGVRLDAAVSSTFTSARRIGSALPLDGSKTGYVDASGSTGAAISVGDDEDDAVVRGFATFNLADVPSGVILFERGELSIGSAVAEVGAPFAGLGGALRMSHVTFLNLGVTALDVPELRSFGTVSSSAAQMIEVDVLAAVADDYEKREVRGSRNAYRFAFALSTDDDGAADRVELPDPVLIVNYLVP